MCIAGALVGVVAAGCDAHAPRTTQPPNRPTRLHLPRPPSPLPAEVPLSAELKEEVEAKRAELVEHVAEVDEALGEHFVLEEPIDGGMLADAIRRWAPRGVGRWGARACGMAWACEMGRVGMGEAWEVGDGRSWMSIRDQRDCRAASTGRPPQACAAPQLCVPDLHAV